MRLALLAILSVVRPLDEAGVDCIGITVSDLDRSVEFHSKIQHCEKVAELEVAGEAYEHLEGVFGLRMRIARLRLGDESIELPSSSHRKAMRYRRTQAATTSRFNTSTRGALCERYGQGVCLAAADPGTYASPGPQRLPDWNAAAAGFGRSIFGIRTDIF